MEPREEARKMLVNINEMMSKQLVETGKVVRKLYKNMKKFQPVISSDGTISNTVICDNI